jgi:O-antigen ligase
VVSVYLVFLIAIPSRLVVGPLGSAGTPAALVGIGCLLWWMWAQLNRSERKPHARTRVRLALGLFVISVGASFVVAMVRPIAVEEMSTADAALVTLAGWSGVLLIVHDGVVDRGRLITLLGRICFAGGALAALGIVQFVTRSSLTDAVSIPGLTANVPLYPILDRSGFARPSGTALHPIEFGSTLAVILPITLARAFSSTTKSVLARWWPVVAIAVAVPISLSRSSLIGAAAALLVLLPTWSRKARRAALAAIVALMVTVFVTVPGMLGQLRNLFTGLSQDASVQSRSGSYDIAWEFIQRSPMFGRGLGTFLPSYRIFDNQYLGMAVEVGVVGTLAFLTLLTVAGLAALGARHGSSDPVIRQYGQSLLAAVVVASVDMALFDSFSFPMFSGATFLVLGLAGCLRRIGGSDTLSLPYQGPPAPNQSAQAVEGSSAVEPSNLPLTGNDS